MTESTEAFKGYIPPKGVKYEPDGEGVFVSVIHGQNYTDLAQYFYNDWNLYTVIRDHEYNSRYVTEVDEEKREMYEDPRNDAEAPLLYAGEYIFVPDISAQASPQSEEQTPEEEEEPAEEKKPILKKDWTGTEHQAPAPKIEVFLPSNTSGTECNYAFTHDGEEAWAKLLSYSFSESTDEVAGSFSFSIEHGEDKGVSTFDRIPIRSVVKIYEGDTHARFIGIVCRRRISKQMTSQGLKRSITLSGKSILSSITEYTVSLDVEIPGVHDAAAEAKFLTILLADEFSKKSLTIKEFIKLTWLYFYCNEVGAGVSATGLSEIATRFIIQDRDPGIFIDTTGEDQDIRYPISCIFTQGNNLITEVWRYLLPKNAYELFGYCDKQGEPKLMARQVPFGDPETGCEDWKNLDLYTVYPISLIGYELEQNDENVYTAFAVDLAGASLDRTRSMLTHKNYALYNKSKMQIYGYRPMEIAFNGYDREENSDAGSEDTLNAIEKLNTLVSYWYSRNDDMYSGTITLCTDFNEPETNPRVGCRVKFLGGEFYINKTEHSWQYGRTPTIKLTVSRGMMYESGVIRGHRDVIELEDKIKDEAISDEEEAELEIQVKAALDAGIIKDIGKQFSELEYRIQ
jgi:hypothetical protein